MKELIKGHENLFQGLFCLIMGIIALALAYYAKKDKSDEDASSSPSLVAPGLKIFGIMLIVMSLFLLLAAMFE